MWRRKPVDPLDKSLCEWSSRDAFTVRDLLSGGCLILGRPGSGKTSSSGAWLMGSIVRQPDSGGLFCAAKPEDAADVRRIFREAGRLKDLIEFDAEGPWRCNFFGCLKRPRDVVQFITTMSEVMKRGDSTGSGGDNSRFYDAQEERAIYNAVVALKTAGEPVTALNIHRFIMSAARTPEELDTPEWQAKYQSQILERGFKAPKTALETHDFELCLDFWVKEWPGLMDTRTRGNILAGIQGTMHVMNTGIVREMTSGETNCSPQDVLAGKWVLVNFPPSTWGQADLLISIGWKHLVELAILERKAGPDSHFCVVWCDEAPAVTTPFDAVSYIPQCRSHKGCLVYLSQSVSSFYAALKGDSGKHQADALLASFSHAIVHASDPVTAKWAASKLGRKKELMCSGGFQPSEDGIYGELFGNTRFHGSFSEHYEQVLQDQAFQHGLRTGGPANNFMADAIVIKSGEPFADGRNHKLVSFSQR